MSSIVAMRDEIKEYIQLLESTGCELSEDSKDSGDFREFKAPKDFKDSKEFADSDCSEGF